MSLISLPVSSGIVELDVCCRCQEVWFDPHELDALPKPPPPPKVPEIPQKAKEIIALHTVKELEAESRGSDSPTGWAFLAGVLGFPVEENASVITHKPWCTWIITALCVVAFLFTLRTPELVSEWGLLPSDCFRHYGATFITSMFLHGGIGHLVGNLYFLLIFGDNVEDFLGKPRYLLLVFLAGLAATFMHILFFADSDIPCIGASGFISGVIAAYAVFFPRVTIRLCYRWLIHFYWFSIPAWGAFALWMIYQVVMGMLTMHGGAGIAFFAHVGGAMLGLIFGFLTRKRCLSSVPENTFDV